MISNQTPRVVSRRDFVRSSVVACGGAGVAEGYPASERPAIDDAVAPDRHQTTEQLRDAVGLVSASAAAQMSGRALGRQFTLLELPQILSEELNLTVVDLNTLSFPSFETVQPAYLEKLRAAADKAGCILTNLKLNQRGLDMNSVDVAVRRRAIDEYKRSIDIASQLGCRWVRPLPLKQKPNEAIHVASYQELCDFAAERNVTLLVENFGWMQADPDSVQRLVTAIGRNVAACPDTGNWNSNEIRYAGLARSFPLAATCDFKAKRLSPTGEHADYDLKRCFDIAWDAGFRGPWAIEHGNVNTKRFLAEIRLVRDMLRTWTRERSA